MITTDCPFASSRPFPKVSKQFPAGSEANGTPFYVGYRHVQRDLGLRQAVTLRHGLTSS